ncbi:LysR family transcriptional regulator [Sphingobium chungangianum]
MIELRHLHYVIATAELGSFNRAAARFNIKQSTLSERVRDLEIRLGISLFERSSRGVSLTRAGRNFLSGARRIVAEVEAMRRHAAAFRAGKLGLLMIGMAGAVSRPEVDELLVAFTRAHKDVSLETCRGSHAGLSDGLGSGKLDALITTHDVVGRNLESTLLASGRLLAVVDANGPFGMREHLSWSDLLDSDILLPAGARGEDLKNKALRSLPRSGASPTRIVEQGLSPSAVIRLIEGDAATLITEADLPLVAPPRRALPIYEQTGLARLPSILSWSRANRNPALAALTSMVTAGHIQ